ncbi:DUF1330 domain-containing protein [Algoriphagus machipongonensis]|uniref:DUF1330 domain-containing protein n=1 Tax=Algoriphagus machipongonensis TaxID=388413 RepID=A3I1H8_9BACT|nr:DUF1330 domain-containing protein [Algoriphagus machipongonensis]EAZ79644.1 hypothetical protein ALPR1_08468 [Algoriphagus machipongonensis]
MGKYIDSNPGAGKRFYQNFHDKGKVVMLNLLKFRKMADYTHLKSIQPDNEMTGEEAYQFYLESNLPELEKAGSRIIYFGKCKDFLIGPEAEKWDAILLVEHASASKFIEFSQSDEYQKNAGHRTAALEDSRLLPSAPWSMSQVQI